MEKKKVCRSSWAMQNVGEMKVVRWSMELRGPCVGYRQTLTISNLNGVATLIFRVDGEVCQIRCNVVRCTRIRIPRQICNRWLIGDHGQQSLWRDTTLMGMIHTMIAIDGKMPHPVAYLTNGAICRSSFMRRLTRSLSWIIIDVGPTPGTLTWTTTSTSTTMRSGSLIISSLRGCTTWG